MLAKLVYHQHIILLCISLYFFNNIKFISDKFQEFETYLIVDCKRSILLRILFVKIVTVGDNFILRCNKWGNSSQLVMFSSIDGNVIVVVKLIHSYANG